MNRPALTSTLWAIGVLCWTSAHGCHDDPQQAATQGPSSGRAAASGAGGRGSTAGVGAAGAGMQETTDDGAPTWSGIYQHVFTTCRLDTCHGSGIIGLNMATKDAAYTSLVNQPPFPMGECVSAGKQRVVPNEPENSLLYLKLNQSKPTCGQQMPPGGELDQAARDRVHAWIMRGAKND